MENEKENGTTTTADVHDITIPGNVYVQCPLVGKKLRAVSACLECEHYAGFRQRFQSDKYPFAVNYQVACRFPFGRALFEMEVKADEVTE